jgi:hypothetical protein
MFDPDDQSVIFGPDIMVTVKAFGSTIPQSVLVEYFRLSAFTAERP